VANSGPPTAADPGPARSGRVLSFWDHLEELRWTLLKALTALTLTTGFCLAFTDAIYRVLQRPLQPLQGKVELLYATPIDPFLIKLKLALLGGVILALPFLLYFTWSFVAPGLTARERRVAWTAIGSGVVFFLIGAGFGYLFLPIGLPYLVSFGMPGVRHLYPLNRYITFCVRLLLGFGLIFECPVIIGTLVHLQLVEVRTLRRGRPYAVIGALLIGAVLTPPDVFSQVVIAVPLMLLYEASIMVGTWQQRRQRRSGTVTQPTDNRRDTR